MPPINHSPFAKRVRDASRASSTERERGRAGTPAHPMFGVGDVFTDSRNGSPTRTTSRGRDRSNSTPTTPRKDKGKRADFGDRYIPNRDEGDLRTSFHLNDDSGPSSPSKRQKIIPADSDATQEQANASFNAIVRSEFDPRPSSPTRDRRSRDRSSTSAGPPSAPSTPTRKRILNFSSPVRDPTTTLDSPQSTAYQLSPVHASTSAFLQSPQRSIRVINKTPYRVLDAPELQDDFYMDLVHWSSTNLLGVGLSACVYLWAAHTAEVHKLCDFSATNDTVTSLSWVQRGSTVAVGTSSGQIHIYDAIKFAKIRSYHTHSMRCGALSWSGPVLSSGSRDSTIQHRDVREASQSFRRLSAHRQEVCGLRWSASDLGGGGRGYLASGGNDNALLVWDSRWDTLSTSSSNPSSSNPVSSMDSAARPLWKFREHHAAVKAISWNPHMSGVLASGGGTADKQIITWNTVNGQMLHALDTGMQVCNLLWSQTTHELVSTHGYSSTLGQNQIIIWRYPSMSMLATLSGHTHRVLYLAMSPDGQTIVTGAGDETLRFWDAFPRRKVGDTGGPGTPTGKRRRDGGVLEPGSQIR